MTDIAIPASLELLVDRSNDNAFYVVDPFEVRDKGDVELERLVEDLADVEVEGNKNLAIDQKHVDSLFSLVMGFGDMVPERRRFFVETVLDMSSRAVEYVESGAVLAQEGKNSTRIILYFILQIMNKAELMQRATAPMTELTPKKSRSKKKSMNSDDFEWPRLRAECLNVLIRAISIDAGLLWRMGIVDETFLSAVWTAPLQLLEERPEGVAGTGAVETAVRALCVKIICACTSKFSVGASGPGNASLVAAMLDAVIRTESFEKYASQICKDSHASLGSALLTEMGNMNMSELARSGSGVKYLGAFLVSLAELRPELIVSCLPLILRQLDSDAWQMRSSILQAMGLVAAHIHTLAVSQAQTLSPEQVLAAAKAAEESEVDAQVSLNNPEKLARERESLLDILVERVHDVSSFVRAAVLKIWTQLLERSAVPVRRIAGVAAIAADRLDDRIANVRKASVGLITALLDFNPYSSCLDARPFVLRRAAAEKALAERLADLKSTAKAAAVAAGNADEDEEKEESLDEKQAALSLEAIAHKEAHAQAEHEAFVALPEVVQDDEVVAIRAEIEYCDSALTLLESVAASVPKISCMLQSKSTADVVEALRFFSRAVSFNVQGSMACMRGTFSLVWHQEENIRNECVAAFHAVFFTDGSAADESQTATKLPAAEVANNLTSLCRTCDDEETSSLDKLIGEMFRLGHFNEEVLLALWTHVGSAAAAAAAAATTADATTAPASGHHRSPLAASLLALCLTTKCQPAFLTATRIRVVAQHSLSSADFSAVKAGCQVLQNAPEVNFLPASSAGERVLRADLSEALMDAVPALCAVIMWGSAANNPLRENETDTRQWFSACEEAMLTLFRTHPCPDHVLASLLPALYMHLSGRADGADAPNDTADGLPTKVQCANTRLARTLFAMGQCTVCSLLLAERLAKLSKKALERNAAQERDDKAAERVADGCEEAPDAMEEEMGMVAAADAENERKFNLVTEQKLVTDNLLGKFHPLIAFVVANKHGKFGDPLLREAAVLALCRYMAVSSTVCERYLPLLFTVLQMEPSALVRTTISIALGDVAFRFPNSLEPWTGHMYARLSDSSTVVRYNALMTLTHLILNDMIKVKGKVSHVVMCLNDPCQKVRELATLFFTELSKRSNNPVYNLLSDIVGQLTHDRAVAVEIETESGSEFGPKLDADANAPSSSSSPPPSSRCNETNSSSSPSSPPSTDCHEAVMDTESDATDATDETDDAQQEKTQEKQQPSETVVAVTEVVQEEGFGVGISLTQAQFESTMAFMLSFVKKEKQADSLCERLLVRLAAAQSQAQRRRLAFCLSQLTVTDKGVKKITENIRGIKDALHDDVVFELLRAVLAKAKKGPSAAVAAAAAAAGETVATATAGADEGGASAATRAARSAAAEECERALNAVRSVKEGADLDDVDIEALASTSAGNAVKDTNKSRAAVGTKGRRGGSKENSKGRGCKAAAGAKGKKEASSRRRARDDSSDEESESSDADSAGEEAEFESAPVKAAVKGSRSSRRVLAEMN
jgi:condensin complex subunit 1